MIRLLGRVTAGAGLIGTATDVVGTVAAGALLVRRYAGLSQGQDMLVTAAAGRGFFLGELVGAMTADTLRVPACEERGRGDERLLLGVARDAGGKGI
jgi:hypothetical protein